MISAKARKELARILDSPPPEQVPGQAALDVPADDRPPPSCEHGNPRCNARPVRPYPCGLKCDDHQPAKTHRRPT